MGNKNFKSDRKFQQRFERREERKLKEGTSRSRQLNRGQEEAERMRFEAAERREQQRLELARVDYVNGVMDQSVNAEMDSFSNRLFGARYNMQGIRPRGAAITTSNREAPNSPQQSSMSDIMSQMVQIMADNLALDVEALLLGGIGPSGIYTGLDPDWWRSLYPNLAGGPTTPADMGKFKFDDMVMADRELVVLPFPARLDTMKKNRPEDYEVLTALMKHAGMRLLSDAEARSNTATAHDIVLSFGKMNNIYVGRQNADNVLPMAALVQFVTERIRRSPFLLRKTMAEKSMQPVARKVNLD